MKKALLIIAMTVFTASLAVAQSPQGEDSAYKDKGSAYAKSIVDYVVKGNYDAVADECLSLYNYAMELTLEEQATFIEGFVESIYEACDESGLGEEFADNLTLHFEDIMRRVTEYMTGGEVVEEDESIESEY